MKDSLLSGENSLRILTSCMVWFKTILSGFQTLYRQLSMRFNPCLSYLTRLLICTRHRPNVLRYAVHTFLIIIVLVQLSVFVASSSTCSLPPSLPPPYSLPPPPLSLTPFPPSSFSLSLSLPLAFSCCCGSDSADSFHEISELFESRLKTIL